ncbi:BadF/BadG/BcrA/BcrD ATPase family protein [Actinopolymorpha singaporensis]
MSGSVRLAVDGGQTMLRMGLLGDTSVGTVTGDGANAGSTAPAAPEFVRQVSVPGFQWTMGEDPVEQQCRRVEAAWEALGRPAPVDVVALGLAGGASDPDSRRRLAPLVARRLGARRVLLTGDDVTTHLGVLAGAAGVVIAAGTGVACLAVTTGGELLNVDGLGYLFGDSGGGFSIGLAGMRAALEGYEGRGPATVLTERAERLVGSPLRLAIKRWYASPSLVADVAAFSAQVTQAAGPREGDPVARSLCLRAGRDLGTSAATAARRAFPGAARGSVPVSWAGGVLAAQVVFEAFAAELAARCPAAALRPPAGGSMAGAARLAAGSDVPHLANVLAHHGHAPS